MGMHAPGPWIPAYAGMSGQIARTALRFLGNSRTAAVARTAHSAKFFIDRAITRAVLAEIARRFYYHG
jgi:hypothetical protein